MSSRTLDFALLLSLSSDCWLLAATGRLVCRPAPQAKDFRCIRGVCLKLNCMVI